jgi:hypothetical protein
MKNPIPLANTANIAANPLIKISSNISTEQDIPVTSVPPFFSIAGLDN